MNRLSNKNGRKLLLLYRKQLSDFWWGCPWKMPFFWAIRCASNFRKTINISVLQTLSASTYREANSLCLFSHVDILQVWPIKFCSFRLDVDSYVLELVRLNILIIPSNLCWLGKAGIVCASVTAEVYVGRGPLLGCSQRCVSQLPSRTELILDGLVVLVILISHQVTVDSILRISIPWQRISFLWCQLRVMKWLV